MVLNNAFQLTYCSNIHPGENWEITFASLRENIPKIKKGILPDSPFGLGLRLSNLASEELAEKNNLETFKSWLKENGVYVFTMNGFPYGNFHGERVKDNVHTPDWTTNERLGYTLRLFKQLGELLPNGMEGGISTSPISYKHWYGSDAELKKAFEEGASNMVKVAVELYGLEQRTGKYLHLDVEPEPDGLLENTEEVLYFFKEYLVPMAKKTFGELGLSTKEAEDALKRYITVCYDVCHFSLAYEEPEDTFQEFAKVGIKVGKIQISAALKIVSQGKEDQAIWDALEVFNEPTYLHQVAEKVDGQVKTYSDLPEVLLNKKPFSELRAHFHVPIFLEDFGLLKSTQDHIIKTLEFVKGHPELTDHLEVETYTWEVLPSDLKIPLIDSVVRELDWVKKKLV